MVSRSFHISEELDRFIRERVEANRFATPSEMVEEGLRLLAEHEAFLERDRQRMREQIEEGYQQALRGELVDGESVVEELRRRQDEAER